MTITMNPWRDEMNHLGLDTDHKGAFLPVDRRPRVFGRPDLVVRVYNQFTRAVMEAITKKTENYFGQNCIAFATKLEFQERNTPHHHCLIWLEDGVL